MNIKYKIDDIRQVQYVPAIFMSLQFLTENYTKMQHLLIRKTKNSTLPRHNLENTADVLKKVQKMLKKPQYIVANFIDTTTLKLYNKLVKICRIM